MLMVVADTWKSKPASVPWDALDSILFVSIADKVCMWKSELVKEARDHFVDFKQVYVVPPIGEGAAVPEQLLVGCGLIHDKDVIVYGSDQAPRGGTEEGGK